MEGKKPPMRVLELQKEQSIFAMVCQFTTLSDVRGQEV